MTQKSIATLTIRGLPDMNGDEIRDLITWIDKTRRWIADEVDNSDCAKIFRARLMPKGKNE